VDEAHPLNGCRRQRSWCRSLTPVLRFARRTSRRRPHRTSSGCWTSSFGAHVDHPAPRCPKATVSGSPTSLGCTARSPRRRSASYWPVPLLRRSGEAPHRAAPPSPRGSQQPHRHSQKSPFRSKGQSEPSWSPRHARVSSNECGCSTAREAGADARCGARRRPVLGAVEWEWPVRMFVDPAAHTFTWKMRASRDGSLRSTGDSGRGRAG
jgi:hypothetical protein